MNTSVPSSSPDWIAFSASRRVASGAPAEVAAKVKALLEAKPQSSVLIFDRASSDTVELDLRGSLASVLRRLPASPRSTPDADAADALQAAPPRAGRPRLGVTAREVTLLPRHWDWLAGQPGGISVTLRKLVEQAQRGSREQDRRRKAQEAAYRFITAMAGNEPHYEEATRMLFAGNIEAYAGCVAGWPKDIREHALHLARAAEVRSPPEESEQSSASSKAG